MTFIQQQQDPQQYLYMQLIPIVEAILSANVQTISQQAASTLLAILRPNSNNFNRTAAANMLNHVCSNIPSIMSNPGGVGQQQVAAALTPWVMTQATALHNEIMQRMAMQANNAGNAFMNTGSNNGFMGGGFLQQPMNNQPAVPSGGFLGQPQQVQPPPMTTRPVQQQPAIPKINEKVDPKMQQIPQLKDIPPSSFENRLAPWVKLVYCAQGGDETRVTMSAVSLDTPFDSSHRAASAFLKGGSAKELQRNLWMSVVRYPHLQVLNIPLELYKEILDLIAGKSDYHEIISVLQETLSKSQFTAIESAIIGRINSRMTRVLRYQADPRDYLALGNLEDLTEATSPTFSDGPASHGEYHQAMRNIIAESVDDVLGGNQIDDTNHPEWLLAADSLQMSSNDLNKYNMVSSSTTPEDRQTIYDMLTKNHTVLVQSRTFGIGNILSDGALQTLQDDIITFDSLPLYSSLLANAANSIEASSKIHLSRTSFISVAHMERFLIPGSIPDSLRQLTPLISMDGRPFLGPEKLLMYNT